MINVKFRLRRIAVFAVTLLAALSFCGCTEYREYVPTDGSTGLAVHYIDVGQADAALVVCDGDAMLIDGGNVEDSSRIAAYLKKQGISQLDYVVSTHGHEDHAGGLAGALSVCSAENILASCREYDSTAYKNFVKAAEKQNLELRIPAPGDSFYIGGARITVLGPVKEYEEENDSSLVLRVVYGNRSFLFTGDMEAAAEADLIESGADLDADVLKVGHHGSSTSSSYRFLREVMPEYAVISCGTGNSYGHPHDEVLSRLRDAGAKLYRTDMQGDIVAKTDGEEITFTAAKNSDGQVNPTAEKNQAVQKYIGNKKSKKFHRPTCSSLPGENNAVELSDRDAALDDGFSPCGSCKP